MKIYVVEYMGFERPILAKNLRQVREYYSNEMNTDPYDLEIKVIKNPQLPINLENKI